MEGTVETTTTTAAAQTTTTAVTTEVQGTTETAAQLAVTGTNRSLGISLIASGLVILGAALLLQSKEREELFA